MATEQLSVIEQRQTTLARIAKVEEFLVKARVALAISKPVQKMLDEIDDQLERGIKTAVAHQCASTLLVDVGAQLKHHEATFRQYKDPAVYIGGVIDEANRGTRDALDSRKKALGKAVAGYEAEQRRQAEVEQRRLQAIADAQAKKAQEREAEALERQASKSSDREEKKELRAAAEETRSAPVVAPTVHVEADLPAAPGLRDSTHWHAEFLGKNSAEQEQSKLELLAAIVDGHVHHEVVEVDFAFLNKRATHMQDGMNRMLPGKKPRLPYPGIVAVSSTTKARTGRS